MPREVIDPRLLAELEGGNKEVTDPSLLAQLDSKAGTSANVSRRNPILAKVADLANSIVEPAATLASGAAAGVVSPLAATVADIYTRATGGNRQEGTEVGQRVAKGVEETMTYLPRTRGGRENIETISKFINDSKLAGLPIADLQMAGNLARTTAQASSQALPMAASAASKVGGSVGETFAKTGALVSGKSAEGVRQGYRAGKARSRNEPESFSGNIRDEVPVDKLLADAQEGLSKMQDEASLAYMNAKEGWSADKTPLNFSEIDNAFQKAKASTYTMGEKGPHSLVDDAERAKIDKVEQVLNEWRNDPSTHTALGLDSLKRRIDAIYPDSPLHKNSQRVISSTRNAVKDAIVRQVPEYADAMRGYEQTQAVLSDIRSALVGTDKTSKNAAINKLLSLGKENKDFRRMQAEALRKNTGIDLMQAAAGQEMKEVMPTGLHRLGTLGVGGMMVLAEKPWLLPLVAASSPRLIGETAYMAGRVAGKLNPKRKVPPPVMRTEEGLPQLPPVAPLLDEQIAALRREQPQGLPELPPLAEGEVPLLPQQPMIEKVMRGEPPVRQIPTQVSPSGEVPFPQLGAIPEMRPTMELGGGNAPLVEALRGGARIPISGEGPLFRNQPVEFTPGGGMNMPIPIEKASEAVGKIQTMIEDYRQQAMKLPDPAQREAALQTVSDLEQMLPAIMEQEGFTGIKQRLYGEGFGYPIENSPRANVKMEYKYPIEDMLEFPRSE